MSSAVAEKPDAPLAPWRDRIDAFEGLLLEHEQVSIPVSQLFGAGLYVREITIPAGVVLVGKIHKHACLTVVMTGELELATEDGVKRVRAGDVFMCPPGMKRAGVCIETCRFLTVHPYQGPERDADGMAAHLSVDTFEQLEQHRRALEIHP